MNGQQMVSQLRVCMFVVVRFIARAKGMYNGQ